MSVQSRPYKDGKAACLSIQQELALPVRSHLQVAPNRQG